MYKVFSITSEILGKMLIPRWLLISALDADLCSGVVYALFQETGHVREITIWVNKIKAKGAIILAPVFKVKGGMLSAAELLLSGTFNNSFSI